MLPLLAYAADDACRLRLPCRYAIRCHRRFFVTTVPLITLMPRLLIRYYFIRLRFHFDAIFHFAIFTPLLFSFFSLIFVTPPFADAASPCHIDVAFSIIAIRRFQRCHYYALLLLFIAAYAAICCYFAMKNGDRCCY